jgi:acyl-coenzyme A thioesterase PaaI-like protein
MNDTVVPNGFERRKPPSPLTDPWEPPYLKRTDKVVILGLRLAEPHTTGHGLIHGGLIATLSDIAMGYSCGYQSGATQLVTIGLAVDCIGSARVGQWLAVEPEVIKTGSTICFAQRFAKADDIVIARASASFRVVRQTDQALGVRH